MRPAEETSAGRSFLCTAPPASNRCAVFFLPAISVKGFPFLPLRCFLLISLLYLMQMSEYALFFRRSVLLPVCGFRLPAGLAFPLGKVTVILFHNALRFLESTHKSLHIGITVLFQNIGQLIQFCGDFSFRLLYLLGKDFALLAFENPLCVGKLRFQLRENIVLQTADFPCALLRLYHQISHMAELMDINIKRWLGRHILFSDKALQKFLCPADNAAKQVGQPAFLLNRLACFPVDFCLLYL